MRVTRFRIAFPVALQDPLVFLLQIERVEQFAGGQHAEGLLIERIKAIHQTAGVHVAPEFIEAGQQSLAVGKPVEVDAVEHHVSLAVPLGTERAMADPKKAGPGFVVGMVLHSGFETDERRHGGISRAKQFGNN